MKQPPNRQASIDSRRIALEREVKLSFPAFDTFVTEYSANISTTGMFVVSADPHGPGSELNFEFSVADDWKLIRGRGQVVWARTQDEGPGRPPGMGIRYLELDPQSRRLIRWIVEKHIREGGKPFELEALRSAVEEALEESAAAKPTQVRRPPRSAPFPEHVVATRTARPGPSRPRARIAGWVGAAVVGIAIVLLVWLSEVGPRLTGTAPSGQGAPAGGPGSGQATAAATESPATPATGDEATPGRPTLSEVSRTVRSWATAWSSQEVDAYLAHYSDRFQPPDGMSRGEWRAQRGDRLTRPRFIQVVVSRLETTLDGEGRAVARFFQAYRSDTYSDEVLKVLELVWEGDTWKIAAERVVG
ncbi:MAG: PilZ domain-containing protein [Thermoanaerobaculia bacterium]|nr:PilZ domain-containing protein [Thermoanaerobaculia bacterium]